jgi:hypothetical protein
MASEENTVSLTQAAPLEPNVSQSQQYTDRCVIDLSAVTEINAPIAQLISGVLEGTGRVDLLSAYICYTTTEQDQEIHFGVCDSASNRSAKQLGQERGGHAFVSNKVTYGIKKVEEVIPPSLFSRQIRPVSSELPTFKLVALFDGSYPRTLELEVLVRDFRNRYLALN